MTSGNLKTDRTFESSGRDMISLGHFKMDFARTDRASRERFQNRMALIPPNRLPLLQKVLKHLNTHFYGKTTQNNFFTFALKKEIPKF